jgi:acyl-CoA synthetase (AMP-forming)/AMP-acid ligase II
MSDLLFPVFGGPGDLAAIEAVPLADRGLPGTTYDLLTRAAALWPDRVAVSVLPDAARFQHPAQRTFAGLLADVHAYANVFHAHGVRRGDAVALLAPNCDELVTATVAAELAGIAAPVNGGLTKETVRELLARSGARVLVTAGPGLAPDVFATATELAAAGQVDALLVLRPTASDGPGPDPLPVVDGVHVAYLATAAEGQPRDAFNGDLPSASDVAALFHTGGTTGTPKLAAHTHANEVSDAWMIATSSLFQGHHDTVLFAALPLFHVNALVVTLLAPLFNGHHVVWAGPLGYRDPALYANFFKLVQRYRITAMSAVPTVYAALAARPVDADISSLRLAIVGASPLPPAVRDSFESATGLALVEGYGLTEATCVSALNFPDHARPGAVGLRLPYVQTKVVGVDADGRWADLPPGQVGTLAIKGPAVFPGYVTGRGPDGPLLDDLGKVRDGWLDTGDLARLDNGFIYLVGRAKDLIIRGGHNIDPAVIENTLLTHPAVTGAQAVGRPDIHSGEVPVAFVTLTPGAVTTPHELQDWARDHVPEPAAAPKAVTVLDALPVTHVGKAFKPALRAVAARDAVTAALRGLPGVTSVEGVVENGAVLVVVGLAHGADETPIKETLDRFSINWRTALDKSTDVER